MVRTRWLLTALGMLWAAPCTMLGLTIGLIGLASGGRARRRGRTVEFWGGAVRWGLMRIPLIGQAAAMTIGHVILGQDTACLDHARDHELVHVRQFERWGVFFFPAYFGWMIYLKMIGRNPYYDNPFEVEAYQSTSRARKTDPNTEGL